MTIRVVLADDQALVRGALAALLSLEEGIDVVGQTGRGEELVRLVEELHPDVALVDIEMPGMDGIEATRQIAAALPQVACLIVTTFGRPGYLQRALDAGARGFVVKETPAEQLADMVRAVHAGQRVIDPALATEALFSGANPLTEREREILRLALNGGTVADIAARVYLSEGTVRNHLSAAIGKMGVRTRAEAARAARDLGWL
ncbi:response regulator transcription factor [Trueperella pyogenes]|uniref:DNA-binding response regulator n=1 Tax=Trueperella pyogenes TaxID=1661 RepID=A0A380MEJ2_9ACTO|nr:response regulator transcription factor [Trueperella pyogenes]ALD73409.1 MerR family transcriptional regulator [Trueperella pyogenes]AWG03639.1 DNA-binding response regulator [Trueperella pyogenes]AWG16370.1 DNA-binding response regulator [Trueperella pyogenes]AZR05250.1 DNA-binding response regulator [Trueperella pyogenes]AZR07118.1 DNA-binding response regulator [Trueperella pyogenes]